MGSVQSAGWDSETAAHSVAGRCLLVVEDNFLVAETLCGDLLAAGAVIVGPYSTVVDALAILRAEGDRIEGAVLDVRLRDDRSFAVADELVARGIPFVFITGYDTVLDGPYASFPKCDKPVAVDKLIGLLARELAPAPGSG